MKCCETGSIHSCMIPSIYNERETKEISTWLIMTNYQSKSTNI